MTGMFVLDGGSLLHKVKWPKVGTYHDTVMCYVRYVRSHFGSQATIVFDGYNSGSSIKDHEHHCRSTKCAPSVQVDESRLVCSNQQMFLANTSNKRQFIAILGRHLSDEGNTVCHRKADADILIKVAEQQPPVTVVAEGTDILVLSVHHVQPSIAQVYMLSMCRARKSMTSKLVGIQKVQDSRCPTAACDTCADWLRHNLCSVRSWKGICVLEIGPFTRNIANDRHNCQCHSDSR